MGQLGQHEDIVVLGVFQHILFQQFYQGIDLEVFYDWVVFEDLTSGDLYGETVETF